ncbi:hypothetical protein LZG00_15855 [Rhodobacteraceae bacterium LMO-12]|nr:hypothetical protein [Rhodobacteraceae bacterium LMO-JJ12]
MTEDEKLALSVEAENFVNNAISETIAKSGDPVMALECLFHWITEASRFAQDACAHFEKELRK